MNKLIVWIIVVVVVAGGSFFMWKKAQGPAPVVVMPYADLIRVTAPVAGSLITSPLTVMGEARGTWYFEASFPVAILDANRNQVAIAPAQAQGEWMTENFVSFLAVLDFTPPATDTGFVVFKKDNPSGLAEHDASVEVPVRFR
ncbi:MAG: Gmad2 immunoglobulin-like domain-containing protein [bacterium]|nr:Gmad2 immunoglobulin-like domain-containing protein [bacterium]